MFWLIKWEQILPTVAAPTCLHKYFGVVTVKVRKPRIESENWIQFCLLLMLIILPILVGQQCSNKKNMNIRLLHNKIEMSKRGLTTFWHGMDIKLADFLADIDRQLHEKSQICANSTHTVLFHFLSRECKELPVLSVLRKIFKTQNDEDLLEMSW